jgi:ABC-type cobalamin transport system permease subunit
LLLFAALALEAADAIAWLVGVAVAIAAAVVASAGSVTGIVLRALAVAVAKLLLPPLASAGGVVLLVAGTGLEALRL